MYYKEDTSDPENGDEMSLLGHRMLDDTLEYLKTIREQPYIPISEEAKNAITILPYISEIHPTSKRYKE